MSVSIWQRENETQRISCDVAIIGGGIVGISAALALQSAGVDVRVIERAGIASGASGRNAGYLIRGASDNYARAVRAYGRDAARQLWALSEENLNALTALGIRKLSTFELRPSCLIATTPQEERDLEESADLLRADRFSAHTLSEGNDALWRSGIARLGLVNPNDGVCNPVELVNHLARQLDNAAILHNEVHAIKTHNAGVTVRARHTDITCNAVMVCTNAYTPLLLPRVAPLISPKRGQMLALRAPENDFQLDHAYYASFGSEYFRRADANTVIVGGWRAHFKDEEVGYEDRTTQNVQGGLEQFAERIFGQSLPVVARWAGTMGFTPDGLPIVGPMDEHRQLWVCAGFTGHGMSLGCRTAQLAIAAMLDEGSPVPTPFQFSRFGPMIQQ